MKNISLFMNPEIILERLDAIKESVGTVHPHRISLMLNKLSRNIAFPNTPEADDEYRRRERNR